MNKIVRAGYIVLLTVIVCQYAAAQTAARVITDFTNDWKFHLNDVAGAQELGYNDKDWRSLSLPHDWSIELPFDKNSPAGTGGGALRGGTGWYRKTFVLPPTAKNKKVFIDFDGVYMNSEVWINGHYLGKRPNGYISFQYELTPYLQAGNKSNVLAVKVNNADQPNSRWYSGSGIYRNVWLEFTGNVRVDHWGTYVTTPQVTDRQATALLRTSLRNTGEPGPVQVKATLYNKAGAVVQIQQSAVSLNKDEVKALEQSFTITQPHLWSVDDPYLYTIRTQLVQGGKIIDDYTTPLGIRYFRFDIDKGFILNGRHVKIRGVCNHHDLGCLGTAVNTRALERQLQLLKAMGCNGIRTSHNPPAPELLDLCDRMGFIVMDEAFDMWKKEKNPYDYHLYWDEWHARDLTDQLLRDRNHPSVFIWSVGNEIIEQWGKDTSGRSIVRELAAIVRSLDTTRPIVTANNETTLSNNLLQAHALDIIGYNYHHADWVPEHVSGRWGPAPFIVTESVSALETRGHYDMPADSIRRWPPDEHSKQAFGNADTTCSAYDNCSTPWGSTHEETMKVFEKYDHISGMFIWTGFDYIGEPTPYPWPARSAYFGIIDLAGFPKDVYYMYKSVWTKDAVLHLLPHWNLPAGGAGRKAGDTVDVWAYYNNADEVELFVNNRSMGVRKKQEGDYHVQWRVPYVPGVLKAVSRRNGNTVLTKTVHTAGPAARIALKADRSNILADGKDLSFVTVTITDAAGNMVPDAGNEVHFTVQGQGVLAAVDNGSQTSMESFRASHRKAFNGLCLAVIKAAHKKGRIVVTATAQGLAPATVIINTK
jgi:beta-galactosidase